MTLYLMLFKLFDYTMKKLPQNVSILRQLLCIYSDLV